MAVKNLLPRLVLCFFWLVLTGAGFAVILNYENAGGEHFTTPQKWPARAKVQLHPKRKTLLMFVHPQCPCTRASMDELNRLLVRSEQGAAVHIWFYKPKELPAENWTRTGLWRSAGDLPGVTLHEDLDGDEARLFGATTSGFVLLYDTGGRLLFQGGITGGRGHAGDNAGENAVVALLAGQEAGLHQTEVYGCSLLNRCDNSTKVLPR